MLKKYDKMLAVLFALFSFTFLFFAFTNREFLNWAFARHQNQLSWYIRPLFLIPFCFFAYKKSWSGISLTIFCIFTSMFWFPEPQSVSDQVKSFLQYEVDYLTGKWDAPKILLSLLVPISLILLGMAFWRKNVQMGLLVIIVIAFGKIMWSILSAGESGKSIIIPAIGGLFICIGIIYIGLKRFLKKE